MRVLRILLFVMTCYFTLAGVAGANLILNGSFELGVDPGNALTIYAPNNTSIDNWDVYLNSIDYIGTYWVPSNGQRSIDVSGEIAGAIQQSFDTIIGYQYRVSFDLAGNPNPSFADKIKKLRVAAAGVFQDFTFDVTGKLLGNMGWTTQEFLFTATDITSTLQFISMSSAAGPALDNVVVEVIPAPLPSSLIFFVSGILGCTVFGRRLGK